MHVIPPATTGIVPTLVPPLALASALVSVLLGVCCLLATAAAIPLQGSAAWRELVVDAWMHGWPASILWPLSRPVQTCLWASLLCAVSALSSWGLYRWRRWGLWSFVALLLAGIVINFACAWWVDMGLAHLQTLLDDPALQRQLHWERGLVALTLYGSAVLFLFLQGGLAWRLLRADVRPLFR